MASVNSREDLEHYMLRRLGQGVVTVEITTDQINDIIDDTLQRFSEEVEDGIEQKVLIQVIPEGTQEIILDDNIMGIESVFYSTGRHKSTSSVEPFSVNAYMSDIYKNLYNTDGSVTTSFITKTYFEQLNNMFSPELSFSFNHQTKKLSITQDMTHNSILAMVVYVNITDNPKIWDHRLIKDLTVANAWGQWGTNTSKYNDAVIVGGMTINSDGMLSRSDQMMDKIEEDIRDKYNVPLGIFIG